MSPVFLTSVEEDLFARSEGRSASEEPLVKLGPEVPVAAANLHERDLTPARELVESRRREAQVLGCF